MALNSSGPISLAGTTAGQSIELENGGNGTTQISLNDTAVRALAGVPTGAITMPTNFWGKSNRVSISYTFSANTNNASLNVTSIGGYSAGKSDITVTVNSGIYLWSSSTATPGLTLSGGTTGDTITLVNNGYIMGMGGTGGARQSPNSGSFPGTAGGPAISIAYPTTINNTNASAYIGGGGGGGGSGNGMSTTSDFAGGGGGAGGGSALDANDGNAPGGAIGASGSPGTNVNVAGGGAGGRIFPGTGGSGGVSPVNIAMDCNGKGGGSGGGGGAKPVGTYSTGGVGGGGGGWGAAGGTAYANNPSGTQTGGAGGSAGSAGSNGSGGGFGLTNAGKAGGKAVALNGNTVTWTSGNTTRVYGSVS